MVSLVFEVGHHRFQTAGQLLEPADRLTDPLDGGGLLLADGGYFPDGALFSPARPLMLATAVMAVRQSSTCLPVSREMVAA